MASDGRGMLRPDESASVKDDDFTIESHSHVDAFAETPADTTMEAEPAPVVPQQASAAAPDSEDDGDQGDAVADGAADGSGEQSQSRLGKADAATGGVKPRAKNKTSLDKRTQKLKHDVDTLTYQRREAERQLADLNRQIAERRTAEPAPAEKPKVEAVAAPMPTVPKYRDYATDEEYEGAVAKYHTDLTAWQQGQISAATTKIRDEITQGVESRFRGAGEEAAARATEQRLLTTLETVRSGKADWAEKAAALKDVTSAWYDPAKHGDAATPFLSDLARTRLAMGLEDGGELLYWLGSDPDRAQAVADLLPNRPIRDAIVHAPSVIDLLDHFATDEGQREFEALKQMHPLRVNQAIGALSARLAGASSGSPARPHPITKAQPSARPPAGTPGARGTGTPPGSKMPPFNDWMAAEDAKELAEKKRAAGIAG